MKKLISIALILASFVSVFCPVSTAQITVGSIPPEELGLLNTLSLMKEEGFSEGPVLTRAEFSDMICRLFKYENYASENMPFRDIDSSHPYYKSISALYAKGAVKGVSKYSMAPNKEISLGEAGIIAVTALGYDKAPEMGLTTYDSQARELGLYDGISASKDDGLTEEMAVKMMYNILFAPIMINEPAAGGINYIIDKDVIMMSEIYDIYETEGIVTENATTSFYGESSIAENEIRIDDDIYINSMEGLDDLIGYYIKAYVREVKAGEDIVVYVCKHLKKNKDAEIMSDDITSAGDNFIEYEKSSKNIRAKLSGAVDVIYNGIGIKGYDLSALENIYGQIKLIDNNNDGYYDLVLVWDYKMMVVQNISEDSDSLLIYDKYGAVFKADLEKKDCSLSVFNRGAEASVKDITAGMPILILDTGERENKRIIEIYMPSEKFEGTLTGIGEDELKIDSHTLNISSLFNVADVNSYMSKNVTVFTDIFGNVIYLAALGEGKYGFLFKMSRLDDINESIQIKVLTTDNEWKKYNLKEKLQYNGEFRKAEFVYDSLTDVNGEAKKQVVRYSVNEDNEIINFQTAQYKESENLGFVDTKTDEMLREKGLFRMSMDKKTRQFVNSMNGLFDGADYNKWVECFLSSPHILVRPDTNDMTENDIQFYTSYFTTEGDYLCEGYDRTEDNYMPLVVVYEDIEAKLLNGFILVDKVVDELDEDEQTVRVLYGWYNGKLNTYKAENENSFIYNNREVKCGDLVRMSENFKHEITGITKLRFTLGEDLESQYTDYDVQDISKDFRSLDSYAGNQMVVGIVDKVSGEYMRVRVKNNKYINVKLRKDARYIIYDDSQKTKLSAGAMSDISVGKTVVARLYYGRLDDIFLYRLK